MEHTIAKCRTFGELVEKMVSIRQKGGSDLVKRENFTEFPEINRDIEFNKDSFLAFSSFGYMERLFRKLSAHYGDRAYAKVVIESYREACGFFAGILRVHFDGDNNVNFEEIEYAWSGKGEIELTWDSFTTWKISAKL